MSCNHCDVKFNFFHKEKGCANCGLAFCAKCVDQKLKIPSKGNDKKQHVCKKCFTILSSATAQNDMSSTIDPPDTFLKRLENLQNPSRTKPWITIYKQGRGGGGGTSTEISSSSSSSIGLSPADKKILERLEKLKDSKQYIPTDSELELKLAKLKEMEISDNSCDATRIESYQKSDDDEEEQVNNIIQRVTEEVNLDDQIKPYICHDDELVNQVDKSDDDSDAEFPYCYICNNLAKYKCLGSCEELYCEKCQKEFHKEPNHKIKIIRQNSTEI